MASIATQMHSMSLFPGRLDVHCSPTLIVNQHGHKTKAYVILEEEELSSDACHGIEGGSTRLRNGHNCGTHTHT